MVDETTEQRVTIIQTLTDDAIAIIMTLSVIGLVAAGVVVPEFLIGAFMLVLGFYFKNK
jgi:membrane-bound ClpP family serine protease